MHSFANHGEQEARLRVEVRPALAMEEMFADVVEMAQAGRMTRRGLPRNILDLALLARAYDREAHAPLLGRRLQRLLLAPLAGLARLRPWRARATGKRRGRDSNPRTSLPPVTRLAGECLQPLGHLSGHGPLSVEARL